MVISERVREQAAIFCSIMACHRHRVSNSDGEWDRDAADYVALLKRYGKAGEIAEAAFFSTPHYWALCEQWAEAECLLRTGAYP